MYIECTLRGLLTVFFRQKLKVIIVFATVFCFGYIYIASLKPTYQAEASMLIKFGQGSLTDLNKPVSQSQDDRSEIIQSYIKLIYSNTLLGEMLKTVDIARLYPALADSKDVKTGTPEQAAIQQLLQHDLDAIADTNSNFLNIRIRNQNPETARDAVNVLVEKFITKQSELYNISNQSFLQQQVVQAKDKLLIAQKALDDLKRNEGISDINQEIDQLIKQKSDLSNASYGSVTNVAYEAVTSAQTLLAKLNNDKATTLLTYQASSPAVRRINESIAATKIEIERLKKEMNSADNEPKNGLVQKIDDINKRIAYLEDNKGHYNDLDQQVKLSEETYRFYQQRSEEAHVNDLLTQQNITHISIVDQAITPTSPVPRHRGLIFLAILMSATLLSLITALAFELIDDRLAYPEQVSALLQLPLLACFEREDAA
jgi:uncharacterized protein involved in exopolysaccharide biosynthesis